MLGDSANNESTPLLIIKAQATLNVESTNRLNQAIDSFLMQPTLAQELKQKSNRRLKKIFSITLILNLLILGGLITACYFIFKNIADRYAQIDGKLDEVRQSNSTVLININSSHDVGLTQSSINHLLNDRVNAWQYTYEHTFNVPDEDHPVSQNCSQVFNGWGMNGRGRKIIDMVVIGDHDHNEELKLGGCWWGRTDDMAQEPYWDDCIKVVRNFCKEINIYQPYRDIINLFEKIKANYVGFGFILLIMSLLTAGQILLMTCMTKRSKAKLSVENGLSADEITNISALCETLDIQIDEKTDPLELGIKLLFKKIHLIISSFYNKNDISKNELEAIFSSINRLLEITKKGILFNQARTVLNTFFEFAFETQKAGKTGIAVIIFNLLLNEKTILDDERFDAVFRYRIFEYLYELKHSQIVNASQAFRICLPLCMTNEELVICSNEDLQMMFDGYLQQAARPSDTGMLETLSKNERSKLLIALLNPKPFISLSIFRKEKPLEINTNGEHHAHRFTE